MSSRRELLKGAGLVGLAAASPALAAAPGKAAPRANAAELQAMLERYYSFGSKASGGPGDNACGAWLEAELAKIGYACRRQSFEVPFFETKQATLVCGDAKASVMPQAIVATTGPGGLTAPLKLASSLGDLTGAIAVVVLPFKRWTTLLDPQAAQPLADAVTRGAAAVILVTQGPTGEAIGLNLSTRRPAVERPVAVLAPKDAQPFLAAAAEGRSATLTIDGTGGRTARRPAFNLIAKLDRKAAKTVVISTPRSGWFACAAERGSGLVVWLWLAKELAQTNHAVNVELIATSGHEYEYLGGEVFLHNGAPTPAATKLWVHIGASAAARDWHELPAGMKPLPSADTQRVLTATDDIRPGVRDAFQGLGGLEATYVADKTTAGGELVNVMAAGYRSAIGLYGWHRYFHTAGDDMRCIDGKLVEPVANAFAKAVDYALRT